MCYRTSDESYRNDSRSTSYSGIVKGDHHADNRYRMCCDRGYRIGCDLVGFGRSSRETVMIWRVVIWTSPNKGDSTEHDTKDAAYEWANEHHDAHAIEIYGPDGFYDGVE